MAQHQTSLSLQTQTADKHHTGCRGNVSSKDTDSRFLCIIMQIVYKTKRKSSLTAAILCTVIITHLCLVAVWSVVVVGSHYWPVRAPAVSQGRREPCQKYPWTVVSWRCCLPVPEVTEVGIITEEPQTVQLPFFFTKAKGVERRQEITRLQGHKQRKRKHRRFTRGRGMLHPLGGLGGGRAGLAGGGVSSPADKLDSGELMGVSVTEEISRQDSDLML